MNQQEFFEYIELLLNQGEHYQNKGDYYNSIFFYLEALDRLETNFQVAPALLSNFYLSTCDKIAFAYFELGQYNLASHYTDFSIWINR